MRINKGEPISRVKCVVDSCEYNEQSSYCIASEIEIQPPDALDTEETDCATFTPRNS